MIIRIIKAPSRGLLEILEKKTSKGYSMKLTNSNFGAIGLVQGKVIEMLCAADIAEKAANVIVDEIHANCPQVIATLAIFGDIADVENALHAIKSKNEVGDFL